VKKWKVERKENRIKRKVSRVKTLEKEIKIFVHLPAGR
jgi:hypothetical protein